MFCVEWKLVVVERVQTFWFASKTKREREREREREKERNEEQKKIAMNRINKIKQNQTKSNKIKQTQT